MIPGNLFIVAAPSGAGKTSLVDAVVKSLDQVTISISHTTRPQRPAEKDGIHYHFVSEAEFQNMITAGLFLEHAQVYGYHYGTSRAWVAQQLQMGLDVILEIDWQGAMQIRRLFPTSVSIFILPPSRQVLEQRLHGRNQDQLETITRRLEAADQEMSHYKEFEYLIVNEVFEKAVEDLQAIIKTYRLRSDRQMALHRRLVEELTGYKQNSRI